MKFFLHQFAQVLSLAGLIAVSAIEALRPGTIGAALNLGLVVLFGGVVLALNKTKIGR